MPEFPVLHVVGLPPEAWHHVEPYKVSRNQSYLDVPRIISAAEIAGKHYAEHDGKPFYPSLIEFITSGPVVAMEWSGEDAVSVARLMMGGTNGSEAAPGTIRGDFGLGVQENIVHGSDSSESAERELAIWF